MKNIRQRSIGKLSAAARTLYSATLPLFAQASQPMPALSDAGVAHLRQSTPAVATAQPRRVLIYNFTCGTYHDEAIVRATRALELMCEKTGAFTTTAGFAAAIFMPEKLRDKFGLKDIKQGGPLPELLA